VVAPAPANELVLKVDHVSGYTFRDARAIEAESAGGM
jgi:hypothetical protein